MIEVFRHNSWATLRLIDFCRTIDPTVLDASVPGTFGTVTDTLAHVVGSDELLVGMVEGAAQQGPPPAFSSLDDLMERGRWAAERWERSLQPEPHPERLVERDVGGTRRLVRVSTVLAQAVHHGNHHRSEVCTTLSAMEIEPPPIDGWAYAAWLAEWAERRRRDEAL
jgi:uncharacterized damage-inducible protein DinB